MTKTGAPDGDPAVVIAGAGPVGLMLAGELQLRKVPVVVLERLAAPMTESRASQLTTLTAELLHQRGVDELLAEAVPEPRAHLAGLPFDLAVDSDYAGNWKVPQYRTESILGRRAERLGATVLRAHELTGVRETGGHVVCTVRGPGGELSVRARYLVGCDGAASTVRRLGGFPASVTSATRELLRADVTGVAVRERRFERLDGGFAVAGTQGGVTRIMVYAAGQDVAARSAAPDFAEVARVWEKVTGEDISGRRASWVDSFDNARGLAGAYRRGRVLLAGDAAHWHLPIGGQALNVGLQDAVNLGWKLAGTVHGWAPDWLLDSYHDERRPVAARVLEYVTAQELLMLGGPEIDPLRSVLGELIGLPSASAHLAGVVSGLSDRWGGRRLPRLRCRTGADAVLLAGLLAGAEPFVVRFGGCVTARCGLGTVYADAEPGAGIDAILARPDGYVAWAGSDEAELGQEIERWFGGKQADGEL